MGSVPRKTHLIKTDRSTLANQCPRRQSPDHWSRSLSVMAVHVRGYTGSDDQHAKNLSPGSGECSLGRKEINDLTKFVFIWDAVEIDF